MALIDMAPAIRVFMRAKPWEYAERGGALIFGVERAEGKIAYAVVTGEGNGYTLALCRDMQALVSYTVLLAAKSQQADEMELVSLQLDQDYLECRLLEPDEEALNSWLKAFGVEALEWPEDEPVLRRHEPASLPRALDRAEEEALSCALLAAADCGEVRAKASGFEQLANGRILCARSLNGTEFDWTDMEIPKNAAAGLPSPVLEDELAARRLRRIPVSGAEVRCAVRRLPMPLDEEAERVPTIMLLMDDRQGVVAAPIVGDYEAEYGNLASEYLNYVEENGRPRRILAADARAYCLLSGLASQLSTPIQHADSLPELNEAMRSFMEYLKSTVEAQQEEEIGVPGQSVRQAEEPGKGGCLYSGFEGDREQMLEYLLKDHSGERPGMETEESFLIRVSYPEDENFWLYASVKKDATLRQLDQFLRNVWVECCGHMSMFHIGDVHYSCNTRQLPGKSMNARLMNIAEKGARFSYDYDMGSTTTLELEIVGVIRTAARRDKALLLAQNFMPRYRCVRCGKRAEMVFRPDMGPIKEAVFCEKCAMNEEEADCMLPLLNSPRTGVCGYGMWLYGEDDE